MINSKIERVLKRCLKRKVRVTLMLVVTFLITGHIGYSSNNSNNEAHRVGNTIISNSSGYTDNYIYVEKENPDYKIVGNTKITLETRYKDLIDPDEGAEGGGTHYLIDNDVIGTHHGTKGNITINNNVTLELKNNYYGDDSQEDEPIYPHGGNVAAGISVDDGVNLTVSGGAESKLIVDSVDEDGGVGIFINNRANQELQDTSEDPDQIVSEDYISVGNINVETINSKGGLAGLHVQDSSKGYVTGKDLSFEGGMLGVGVATSYGEKSKNSLYLGDENTETLNIKGGEYGVVISDYSDSKLLGKSITIGKYEDESNKKFSEVGVSIGKETTSVIGLDGEETETKIFGGGVGVHSEGAKKVEIAGNEIAISGNDEGGIGIYSATGNLDIGNKNTDSVKINSNGTGVQVLGKTSSDDIDSNTTTILGDKIEIRGKNYATYIEGNGIEEGDKQVVLNIGECDDETTLEAELGTIVKDGIENIKGSIITIRGTSTIGAMVENGILNIGCENTEKIDISGETNGISIDGKYSEVNIDTGNSEIVIAGNTHNGVQIGEELETGNTEPIVGNGKFEINNSGNTEISGLHTGVLNVGGDITIKDNIIVISSKKGEDEYGTPVGVGVKSIGGSVNIGKDKTDITITGNSDGLTLEEATGGILGDNITIIGTEQHGLVVRNDENIGAGTDGSILNIGNENTKKIVVNGKSYGMYINENSTANIRGDEVEIIGVGNRGSGIYSLNSTNNIFGDKISIGGKLNAEGGIDIASEEAGVKIKSGALNIGEESTESVVISGQQYGIHSEGADNMIKGKKVYILGSKSGNENGFGIYADQGSLKVGAEDTELVNIIGDKNGASFKDVDTDIFGKEIYVDITENLTDDDYKDYYAIYSEGGTTDIGLNDTEIVALTGRGSAISSIEDNTTTVLGKEISLIGNEYYGIYGEKGKITVGDSNTVKNIISGQQHGISLNNSIGNVKGKNISIIGEESKGVLAINSNEVNIGRSALSENVNIIGKEIGASIENSDTTILGYHIALVAKDDGTLGLVGKGTSGEKDIVVGDCSTVTNTVGGIDLTNSTADVKGQIVNILGEIAIDEATTSGKVDTAIDLIASNLTIGNCTTTENVNVTGEDIGVKIGDKDSIANIYGNNIAITGKNDSGIVVGSGALNLGNNEFRSDTIYVSGSKIGLDAGEGSNTVVLGREISLIGTKEIGINGSDVEKLEVGDCSTEINRAIGDITGIKLTNSIESMKGKELVIAGNKGEGVILQNSTLDASQCDTNTISIFGAKEGIKAQNSEGKFTANSINVEGNSINDGIKPTDPEVTDKLQLYSVVEADKSIIDFTGYTNIVSKNNLYGDLQDVEKNEYTAVYAKGGDVNFNGGVYIDSPKGVALYASSYETDGTTNSTINIDNGNFSVILGDIVAGKAGIINIKGNGNYIGTYDTRGKNIEVLAGNGGKINLDISNGMLIGRVDDYYELEQGIDLDKFNNNKFFDDIESKGSINITMDKDSQWETSGQSFVSNINYDENNNSIVGDNFGVIDLSKRENTAINIKNLGTEGEFVVDLDHTAASGNQDAKSNMIYIKNIRGENTEINIRTTMDSLNLKPGEKLRFATLGKDTEDNYNDTVKFNIKDITEGGIGIVRFKVENEKYNSEENENVIYNGDETSESKPGNDYIDGEYMGGNNHFLVREDAPSESDTGNLSYIGNSIVEIAKSTYSNAIFMDTLHKRLGDMRFAQGEEGIWVRLRNDRVGEDEYYRLCNYMTQLGYDKVYDMKDGKGKEHRGIAIEYGRGDMEYKSLNGESETDRYILSIYDTRLRNNGVYTDYVLRGGIIKNDYTVYGQETKADGDFDTMLLGASIEVGKRIEGDKKIYIEPQAQLQYTYIDSTDYDVHGTVQDTKVELDEIHSLIGRLGVRIGRDINKGTIYAKADINHEFLGDEEIFAKDSTRTLRKVYHNDNTWYDIGVGMTKKVREDLNLYADVERQFGDNKDNSWQFNLGFRYEF